MSPFPFYAVLDEQEFTFLTGYQYRGASFSCSGKGARVVLRAFDSAGKAIYTLHTAPTLLEAVERILEALSHGNSASMWSPDKFYSQGGD